MLLGVLGAVWGGVGKDASVGKRALDVRAAVVIATAALHHTCRDMRSVRNLDVAAGQTSIATTRIEPTASKLATVATATRIMVTTCSVDARKPRAVARAVPELAGWPDHY